MLKIVENKKWGKVLVADQDLLPGTELFCDEVLLDWVAIKTGGPPLEELLRQQRLCCEHVLTQFTPVQRGRFLLLKTQLPSPISESARETFLATKCEFGCQLEDIEPTLLLSSIARQRCFVPAQSDRRPIFAVASLLHHSCAPNCSLQFRANDCVCRVITPIRKGEELTTTLNEEILCDNTAVRREYLIKWYDFTCHCPRCDAPGDDTRQFKCFDKRCTGYHLACQPRQADAPAIGTYDVEYVEPHLLPCTVCQRSPPLDFQARMFDYEDLLEEKMRAFLKIYQPLMEQELSGSEQAVVAMASLMTPIRLPLHRHMHGLRLAPFEFKMMPLAGRSGLYRGADKHTRIPELASEIDASFDIIIRLPSFIKYKHVTEAVEAYASIGMHEQAVALARRILRAHRIREGRTDPNFEDEAERIAAALSGSLTKVSAAVAAVPEGCCVYCGESPEHAAMKRSRCGACKQVIYCGAACQKAHWALHKKECRKNG